MIRKITVFSMSMSKAYLPKWYYKSDYMSGSLFGKEGKGSVSFTMMVYYTNASLKKKLLLNKKDYANY